MIGETQWLHLSHVGSETVDETLFPMFSIVTSRKHSFNKLTKELRKYARSDRQIVNFCLSLLFKLEYSTHYFL